MSRLATWMLALAIVAAVGVPWLVPVEPFYADSDSMSPAIEKGDLYIVVESDEAEVGDIATFESADRGGYVTHRVVATDGRSYVTRGDANPSTDQAGGMPPVERADLIGTVATVAGRPLVVPGAGSILKGLPSHRAPLVAIGTALIVGSLLFGGARPVQSRDVVYVGDLVVPLLVGGLLVSGFVVVSGWSTQEVGYVAVEGGATAPSAVPVDEAVVREASVDTFVPPFTTVLVEAEGLTVADRSMEGSSVELDIRVPALESPGPYAGRVKVYAYPATLPRGVIEGLHAVHPLAALLGSLGAVFGFLGVLYLTFLDGREPLRVGVARWRRRLRRVFAG